MYRMLLLVMLLIGAIWVTACSDDDEPDIEPTPEVTPEATSEPEPTPIVQGNVVTFESHGYRAHIPEGWTFRPNLLKTDRRFVDAFFAPVSEGDEPVVHPNIAVSCEPEFSNSEEFAERKLDLAKRLAGVVATPSSQETSVGEHAATELNYERQLEEQQVAFHQREVVFTNERCGWVVSLTTRPEEVESFADTFEKFLTNLELLS